jgi:hypothetical protein
MGSTTDWIHVMGNPTYTLSSYYYTRWSGKRFKMPFTGTKVAWIGPRTAAYGKARVYLDGILRATIDQSGATGWRQRIWESPTVKNGAHTLEIVALGALVPGWTNTTVVVDAFDVTTP